METLLTLPAYLKNFFKQTFTDIYSIVISFTDTWKDGGNSYVASPEIRKDLDEIALKLSREKKVVRTRFNHQLKYAELYTSSKEVIARVEIHEEMGRPNEAIVTIPSFFPEASRGLFEKTLRVPVTFKITYL